MSEEPQGSTVVVVEKAKLTLDEAYRLLLEASNLMPLIPNNPEDDASE